MDYFNILIGREYLTVVFTETGLNHLKLIEGSVKEALEYAMPHYTPYLELFKDGGRWLNDPGEWDGIDGNEVEEMINRYIISAECECDG